MIGIFDSGVGGLTVLKRLISLMPKEDFIYYADQKNCPYGTKTLEEIKQYVLKACLYLEKQMVRAIVIACNTASLVVDEIRDFVKVPVYDIISPNISIMKNIAGQNILIIGTIKTIEEKIYEKVLQEKNNVVGRETQFLTFLAENMQIESAEAKTLIIDAFKNIKKRNMLILACTHFPHFEKIFKENYPEMNIYDCGLSLSLKIYNDLKSQEKSLGKCLYVTSGNEEAFKKQIKYYGLGDYNNGVCRI